MPRRRGTQSPKAKPSKQIPKPLCRNLPRPVPQLSPTVMRSEEHTSELQSQSNLVCRLLLEKKKIKSIRAVTEALAFEMICYRLRKDVLVDAGLCTSTNDYGEKINGAQRVLVRIFATYIIR